MMTEDEAKKMRCCSGSAAHPQHDGGCCASQCMAWRWSEVIQDNPTDEKCPKCNGSGVCVTGCGETAGGDECPDCGGKGYVLDYLPTGYCGLAGKP